MAKLAKFVITVRGSYPFPIDMLRYDCLHPATESDSAKIARTLDPQYDISTPYEIQLTRLAEPKWEPTLPRWNSHLWKVTNIERRNI